ncbi:MAG: CHASE2 domain-containing protein [Mariprofundaceae bacterium]|nr:CHASE2 domain-containing protein [Mariprofundaceae bacterium]
MNNLAFWKSDWFIGVLLTLLFTLAYNTSFDPLKSLDFAAYDIAVDSNRLPASEHIVIVDIDEASVNAMGRWPWPRSEFASITNKLSNANARIIGLNVPFVKKQRTTDAMNIAALLRKEGQGSEAKRIEAQIRAMDGDYMLSSAVKKSGNVYIAMHFDSTLKLTPSNTPIPTFLKASALSNTSNIGATFNPTLVNKLDYPFNNLASSAAGIGFANTFLDSDGISRSAPLIIEYKDVYLPSLALLMAARDLNMTASDIRVNLGLNLELGMLDIISNDSMRIYPAFHGNDASPAFKHYSFHDVILNHIPNSAFNDKIVLIGFADQSIAATYNTPINSRMSNTEFQAHVLQSILDNSVYSRPSWAELVEYALIMLIGLYLIVLLPRTNMAIGAIVSTTLFILLLAASFIVLSTTSFWLQTMSAAILLVTGHVAILINQYFSANHSHRNSAADSSETNKMLGLSFQSQGMLDMAFDKFRKCPINDDILQCIYNLALDFERKRQFNKASSIYEYIHEHNPSYKDVQVRMERMKNAGDTMIFGASTAGGISNLLITGGAKPTLGRYEIVREIGKGAMGTVYLGKDPKINREVAIKTMALAQEFEPDEMEEVKARFFREAETAGMLNHPNIVTIYDAGDEHDLAYIAMEFLDGVDLAPYTKKGKLFPASATMKICGKVAEALHYAQSQNVVHRDIKPANIMLLKDKTIKVTDFGIARITASSKTKTGVVLGTPSYMSPEQLSGKHVDGRSDIFSLGVMMYEMLCGVRPFRGDSMATLMFQIANEPHPDIREHNDKISGRTARLLDHMLVKDPEMRIANGAAVIKEIIQCLHEMTARGVK